MVFEWINLTWRGPSHPHHISLLAAAKFMYFDGANDHCSIMPRKSHANIQTDVSIVQNQYRQATASHHISLEKCLKRRHLFKKKETKQEKEVRHCLKQLNKYQWKLHLACSQAMGEPQGPTLCRFINFCEFPNIWFFNGFICQPSSF